MKLFEYREPMFTPGIVENGDFTYHYVSPSFWWKVLNAPTNFRHAARVAWNWRQLSLPRRVYLAFYIGWSQVINP